MNFSFTRTSVYFQLSNSNDSLRNCPLYEVSLTIFGYRWRVWSAIVSEGFPQDQCKFAFMSGRQFCTLMILFFFKIIESNPCVVLLSQRALNEIRDRCHINDCLVLSSILTMCQIQWKYTINTEICSVQPVAPNHIGLWGIEMWLV